MYLFCILFLLFSSQVTSQIYSVHPIVPKATVKSRVHGHVTTPHSAIEFNRTINVKTVLFSESDTCKICWSPDELNLLIARRLMQDLIPKRMPKDFRTLLDYLNTCISIVKAKSSGKLAQIIMKALYDSLGGYLHSVVIPVLNEAYYAGNVDYTVTSQLHYLLGQMMTFLGTNGAGWANPCNMAGIPTKVAALPLRMCAEEDACNVFVLLDHRHRKVGDLVDENNESLPICSGGQIKIQLPFLDDNSYPSAIAVPLKDHALFSLMSECSVNLIPKYYIMAMRCLGSARFSTRDIVTFNHQLYHWIISTVVPHLEELDRWYPGFGGVMRVVETMNRRGLATTEPIKTNIKPPQINYSACFGTETCSYKDNPSTDNMPFWIWILIGLGALLMCLLLFCCVRRLFALRKKSDGEEVNTLVSLYCGLREPSNQDEKSKQAGSGSRLVNTMSSYSSGVTSGEATEY